MLGVADQDEPSPGPDGLDQPGHQRQRHHRRLIDDHDVVRQPVVPVVPEASAGVGTSAEQPVQRRRVQVAEPVAVLGGQGRDRVPDRFLQPGRRFAGGCGQGDARRLVRLGAEQRE